MEQQLWLASWHFLISVLNRRGQVKKNHPVPFCGSSVTESNFQAVLLVVPSEYLSHWQKFTIAAMPTVCCPWKDDKIVCNNSGKLCEEFLDYGSSPTVLVFVHPCSHRSYELSQVSFTVLFVFPFFESWMPQSKNSPFLLSWELCEEQ